MPADRHPPTRPRGPKKTPTATRVHRPPMPQYPFVQNGPQEQRQFRAWDRQMKKTVERLEQRMIAHYDLVRALEGKRQLKPRSPPPFHDYSASDTPLEITDKHGYPLVVVLPNVFSEASADKIYDTLHDYHKSAGIQIPSGGGADGHGRGAVDNYVSEPGFLTGVAKLAKIWHAVGQTKHEPVAATNIVKSGTSLAASCQLFQNLRPLSARVNSALKHVDRPFYDAAVAARATLEGRRADLRALNCDDNLILEGREIMYNRKSTLHRDLSDHKRGWAALKAVRRGADYEGGYLHLPELNVRVRYGHRDLVLVRGRLLQHAVDPWTGGQRFAVAHFTHTSYWSYLGVQPPSPLADADGEDE